MKENHTKIEQKGFTLIESLVSIFVFSVIAASVTGILIRAMQIERRAFGIQAVQENVLSVFGIMSREIRVATVAGPDNLACTAASLDITVYNSSGTAINVTYRLNSTLGTVERVYNGVVYEISTQDVIFNNLKFCIRNTGQDDKQPRVTILASVSNRIGQSIPISLQTTITSRDDSLELQN